jgi:hypothetical protein
VIPYRHRQIGWKLLLATAVAIAFAVWLTAAVSPATRAAAPALVYGLFAVLALAALLFATLTVEVDDAQIRVSFGVGLVRKTIALADVLRCEPIAVRAWWGWGVHWTPSGWLYNVGGRTAIRVLLARERAVIIGSDDAGGLKAAIDARIGKSANPRNH